MCAHCSALLRRIAHSPYLIFCECPWCAFLTVLAVYFCQMQNFSSQTPGRTFGCGAPYLVAVFFDFFFLIFYDN